MSRFHSGWAWIGLAAVLAAARPSAAEPPCRAAFERLRFRAEKALLLSGEVDLRAAVEDAETARRALRACGDDEPCAPAGDCIVLLDAATDAPFHHSQELTWLDASHGGVLQVLQARRGRRWRLVRQTAGGHHQWTRRPAGRREKRGPVDGWSDRSESHVAWPEPAGGRPRTSSFALLHQAMQRRLDREGAKAEFLVHSKGALLSVTLAARELVTVDVEHDLRRGTSEARVSGPVALRRVEVSGDALGAEGEESPVGLLGMSSGIELYLEPGTGLPVEVRGTAKKLGRLRVRLAEAVLPEATAPASR